MFSRLAQTNSFTSVLTADMIQSLGLDENNEMRLLHALLK